MPAFFHGEFWNLANAEFWVGAGLVVFFGILILVKVPGAIAGQLDATAAKIQGELDEAARLRTEAEALLKQIRAEKAEAEAQAAQMLAAAEALAEQRIAQAEIQATAEVKAAAADMAARAAEQILAARLAGQTKDPLVDAAIAQIGTRLN